MGKIPHWQERVEFQWSHPKRKTGVAFQNFSFFFFFPQTFLWVAVSFSSFSQRTMIFLLDWEKNRCLQMQRTTLNCLGSRIGWLVQLIALTLQKHLACCLHPVRSRLPLGMEWRRWMKICKDPPTDFSKRKIFSLFLLKPPCKLQLLTQPEFQSNTALRCLQELDHKNSSKWGWWKKSNYHCYYYCR